MNELEATQLRTRWALLLGLFACLLLPACANERGELHAFETAVVMDDGRTTLFTANRGTFVYRGGDSWGKGARSFTSDELLIGTLDLTTGTAEVLHVESAEDGANGRSGFTIVSTRGTRALLRRYVGSGVADTSRVGWYQLDVPAGDLERVVLGGAGAGEVSAAHLVSDSGDILVLSKPKPEQQRFSLALRRPDGAWEEVASDADYRGVRRGELFFWVPGDRMQAWSLATGGRRSVLPREAVGLDRERETKPVATVMPRDVQRSSGSYLELYPDRSDSSVSRRLALSVEELPRD